MRLDVHNFGGGEVEFDDRDAGSFQVGEETYFGGLEEHEGTAFAIGTASGTADAVNIVTGVVGGVELDDPFGMG